MEKTFKGEVYLDIQGLQEFLIEEPKKQTIYNWVMNEKIPFTKMGGKKLWFKKEEITKWIEDGRPENYLR